MVGKYNTNLLQSESQSKQIEQLLDCIRKNIATYEDMVSGLTYVNSTHALAKLHKLNNLMNMVDDQLQQVPLDLVASSKKSHKTYIYRAYADEDEDEDEYEDEYEDGYDDECKERGDCSKNKRYSPSSACQGEKRNSHTQHTQHTHTQHTQHVHHRAHACGCT